MPFAITTGSGHWSGATWVGPGDPEDMSLADLAEGLGIYAGYKQRAVAAGLPEIPNYVLAGDYVVQEEPDARDLLLGDEQEAALAAPQS